MDSDVTDRLRRAYEDAPEMALAVDRVLSDGRRRRRTRAAARLTGGAAAAALVVVGLLSTPWDGGRSDLADAPTPSPTAPTAWDPAALVGAWTVTLPGEGVPATLIELGDNGYSNYVRCGASLEWVAFWEASGTHLLLDLAACDLPRATTATVRYEGVPGGWELRDSQDRLLATLAPVTSFEDAAAGAPVVPRPLASVEDRRAAALDLPAGWRTPTAEEMAGSWEAVQSGRPTGASYTFDATGGLQASDGCNTTDGNWSIDEESRLLSTWGGTTLMMCRGEVPDLQAFNAAFIVVDGDELVLLAPDGEPLERLRRVT